VNLLSRRDFLRAGGLAVAGAGLAACSKGGGTTKRSLRDIIAGRSQNVTVVSVQGETLAGQNRRFPFALFDLKSNQPYTNGSAKLWVAKDQTSPALGPFQATWHDEGLGAKGVYVAHVPLATDGPWLVLAVATAPGASQTLVGGTQVGVGRRTKQPVPGDKAISVATPTFKNHRGVNPICTQNPPCSMHDISLDDALANGKPTVLIIATPEFCESRTCGPEVAIVDAIKKTTAGVNFVHIEQFKDDTEAPAKGILAPGAAAWKLEEEPSVYFIGKDGMIVERFVGAAAADEVDAQAKMLTS
jgi:hypothetical protein